MKFQIMCVHQIFINVLGSILLPSKQNLCKSIENINITIPRRTTSFFFMDCRNGHHSDISTPEACNWSICCREGQQTA